MKKLLTLLLTMSLMLSVTACGGKGKGTGSDDADVQTKVEASDKKDDEVEMPEIEDKEVETKNEEKSEISPKPSETTKPSIATPSEHKHSYASAVTKAATCSVNGIKTFTCSCGESYIPKEVYFKNGQLVAHCYVVNGYSTYATGVNISEISVTGKNDTAIAHAYFGAQNLSIAPLSYVEHTFTFGPDTIASTYINMSTLGFDATFSANH